MNNQEAFNKVWQWFVVEGHGPSVDKYGDCLYRGPDGCKCAIGVLIPDDVYHPALEGTHISALMGLNDAEGHKPLAQYFSRMDGLLLARMQRAHDNAASHPDNGPFKDQFEKRMRLIAQEFKLTILGEQEVAHA